MAKQVVALEARLDSGPAEGSVKSLKAQLREAQADVAAMSDKFGETSKEAANAARRAAELKDRIGDAKALTDAFSPDKKFNAFAGALQGVVGGFTAVQGAMGLVGSESKDVEKLLLKVNSAMALSQGLNAVTESIDNFKNLGTVLRGIPIIQKAITAAQWLWNAAMAANPIGAIVAAVAALIAGVVALTKYLIDNSNANKTMAKEIEKSTKALNEQSKAYQKNSDELQRQQGYTLELAKAKGATTKEIRALETKLMDEKIAHLQNARQIAVNTFETEKNTLAKYKAAGATDEVITKQRELTQKALEEANKVTADLNKSLIDQVELQRKHNVQVAQEKTDAAKKDEEEQKKANQKAKEERKKNNEEIIQENKKQNELQRQLTQKNYLDSIKDADFRAKEELRINFENKKKEIQDSKASTKEKNESIILLEQEYNIAKQKLDADAAKKREENRIAQDKATDELVLRNRLQSIKDEHFKVQQEIEINRQQELDANLEKLNQKLIDEETYLKNKDLINAFYNGKQKDEEKKISDERIKIAQAEAEAKTQLNNAYLDSIGAGIGILKMFTEKNKGLQKAALIAENALTIARIILDTQKANIAVVAKYAGVPGGSIPAAREILANKIKAGIGIATAIAATAKGLQGIGASGGGASGGGSNTGGTSGGGGGVTAPVAPQLSNTILNQQAINQTGNAAIRTYVVESDVAGNQERIERLNRAARIN